MNLVRLLEELLSGDAFERVVDPQRSQAAERYVKEVTDKYMEEAKANLKEDEDPVPAFLKAKRKAALEIIENAKNSLTTGDNRAVDYLYNRFINITKKNFWRYYVGPNRKAAAAQGKTSDQTMFDFAATAWELLKGSLKAHPVSTFKPEIFSLETDLIKQLGGWYSGFIENEAVQKWKKEVRKGLSGKRKQRGFSEDDWREAEMNEEPVTNHYSVHGQLEDPSTATYKDFDEVNVVSYDSTDNPRGMEAATAVQSHDEAVEAEMLMDEFTNYLSTYKIPMFKKVWDLQREGYSKKDISEKLGISQQNTSAYWRRIKNLFKEYFGL